LFFGDRHYFGVVFGFFIDSAISLDATLADYAIDDIHPALNESEKIAKIRHLLTSSSDVFHPAAAADNKKFPPRNSQSSGEEFVYNNWDFNAPGTIFEKMTNRKIFEFFHQKIAFPTGMEDFIWQEDGRYDWSEIAEHPAYHFDRTARDMARLGWLMLQNGNWKGQQIVPAEWLKTITRSKIPVSDAYGGGRYGDMWWVR